MERMFLLTNSDCNAYARSLFAKLKNEHDGLIHNLGDKKQIAAHSRRIASLHRELGEIFCCAVERTIETIDGSRVVFIDADKEGRDA